MSSTETDASDVPIACKPKPKPKTRAKLKASGSKQDKPDFAKKLLVKLEQLEACGTGCKWCNSSCLKIALPFLDSLQDWRKRFAALGMKRLTRNSDGFSRHAGGHVMLWQES